MAAENCEGESHQALKLIQRMAYHGRLMVSSHKAPQARCMTSLDDNAILTRAQLALDATAIGQAMLDGDMEEARFRAHFLRSQASDLGLDEVANAALRVITFLPPEERLPQRGIGVALLHLCDTLSVDA
jgi:hypothetical protein